MLDKPDTAGKLAQALRGDNAAYREWETRWITPLSRAVHEHRFADARVLLEAAQAARENEALAAEVYEALEYLLLYWHCRSVWHSDNQGYTQQDYDAMLARFRAPAASWFGDIMRRNYLVQIRCNGTSDSFDELTRAEIDALLTPLPEHLATPAWQQLARWAYEHRDMEILERAYEVFLELPGNSMAQAKWQRVSLMHGLLSGSATATDARNYLALLHLRPQLREFRNEFWPKCLELGLVDEALERQLAEREAAIMATE